MSSIQPTHEKLPSLRIKTDCSVQTGNCPSEKRVENATLKLCDCKISLQVPRSWENLRDNDVVQSNRACCYVKQEIEICLCGEE